MKLSQAEEWWQKLTHHYQHYYNYYFYSHYHTGGHDPSEEGVVQSSASEIELLGHFVQQHIQAIRQRIDTTCRELLLSLPLELDVMHVFLLAVLLLVVPAALLLLFITKRRKKRLQQHTADDSNIRKEISSEATAEKDEDEEREDEEILNLDGRIDKHKKSVDLSQSDLGQRLDQDSRISLLKSVDWSSVTQLDLRHNFLTNLPSIYFLSQLTRLTELNIRGNHLSDLPPNALTTLRSLTSLDIGDNRFEYFPQSLFDLHLKRLIMDRNFVVVLPPDIDRMQELEELDISHNGLLRIPHQFAHLKKLKRLSLQGNRFMNHVTGILAKMTADNPELSFSLAPAMEELTHARRRTLFGWKSSLRPPPATPSHKNAKEDVEIIGAKTGSSVLKETKASKIQQTVDDDKIRKMRVQAIREVLDSERRYINFIRLLYDYYHVPIMAGGTSPVIKDVSTGEALQMNFSDEILPPKQVNRSLLVPQDLVAIIKFNESLFEAMSHEIPDEVSYDSCIGHIFSERAVFLKLYSSYVGGHHVYQQHLIAAMDGCPRFRQELEKGRCISDANGLDLMSLLIMPIQRLPRYSLLLENVIRYTPPEHKDYTMLKVATEKIVNINVEINNRILETSKRMKVVDISRELGLKELVQPHRLFISESESLTLQGSRVGIFLFNDLLVVRDLDIMNRVMKVLKQTSSIRLYELLRDTLVDPVNESEYPIRSGSKNSFSSLSKRIASYRSVTKNLVGASSPEEGDVHKWYTLSVEQIRNTKSSNPNSRVALRLSASTDEYRMLWVKTIREVILELKNMNQ